MTVATTTLRAALLAGLFAASCMASAQPALVMPASTFFNPPEMSRPVLSPDGDALAVLLRTSSGRRQLAILDTADLHKITMAAGYTDFDIDEVHWVDDTRLVYSVTREDASARERQRVDGGLYAVDRDGSNAMTLIMPSWNDVRMQTGTNLVSHQLTPDYVFSRTLRDGSSDVIAEHYMGTTTGGSGERYHVDWEGSTPMRLNTRTGRTAAIAAGGNLPHHVSDWMVDDHGVLLGGLMQSGGQTTLLSLDAPGQWTERAHFASYKAGQPDAYSVQEVGADGRIYVLRSLNGADALYRLNLLSGKPEGEPLLSADGFDIRGRLIGDTHAHKLLGIRYESDAEGTAWLDPSIQALQTKIDALLPGLINSIDLGDCACAQRVVITSHSDRQPASFFLYDRATAKLISIGQSRPAIDARQMAVTSFQRIRARDGQDLPVYVTQPQGKGPWPTVVLVHGGPQVRGWSWRWDAESQFLASRGYLVVKPEYRGSEGYGDKLYLSGFKQWGLKSQDDIADATTWAAAQGLADPKRTCIAGASYGGYATLMGLVRYGDLYRCSVAWAAVADIDMMYDLWWSDADDEWKGYGMPEMVGDRVKDAAQFAATSPLQQAARIQRPLLLAHGGVDHRVPIEHAQRLRNALQAAHAPVTWLYYQDEGHGWFKPETNANFYEKMASFLDANIGAGSSLASTATQATP